MAWLSGWDNRIKLTVDHTKFGLPQSHFPVAIFLSSVHGDCVFDELASNGNRFKIAFTKADGTTQLYGEIEKWDDASEEAIIHVSRDGWEIPERNTAWTKEGIVLEPEAGYDSVIESSVIYEGDPQILTEEDNVFKMWYHQFDSTQVISGYVVGYAESANGTNWTHYGSNPILAVGGEMNHTQPFVMKYGSTYYMYVHSDSEENVDRYYSSDGIDWTKDQDNTLTVGEADEWDDFRIGNTFVWVEGTDDWRMMYEASGESGEWNIGYATSTDGKTWTKSESNPVLAPTNGAGGMFVHKVGSTFYMWYHSTDLPSDICLAKSTDLISWAEYTVRNPVFYRSEDYEGVGDAEAQVADPHLIEVNGTTYMFYDAIEDQSPPPNQNIALATSDLTLEELVAEDTVFYMYYDSDHADNTTYIGDIGSAPGEAVWSSHYLMVCHMVDDTTSTLKDSTDNSYDMTKKGANEPLEENGKEQHYDGLGDYITQATVLDTFPANGLISVYFCHDDATEAETKRLLVKINDESSGVIDLLDAYWTADGTQLLEVRKFKNNSGVFLTSTTDFDTGGVYHTVTVSWGSWGFRLYVDGIEEDYDANTDGISNGTTRDFILGGYNWGGSVVQPWDGVFRELRIATIQLSTERLQAEHSSLTNALLTYGSQEISSTSPSSSSSSISSSSSSSSSSVSSSSSSSSSISSSSSSSSISSSSSSSSSSLSSSSSSSSSLSSSSSSSSSSISSSSSSSSSISSSSSSSSSSLSSSSSSSSSLSSSSSSSSSSISSSSSSSSLSSSSSSSSSLSSSSSSSLSSSSSSSSSLSSSSSSSSSLSSSSSSSSSSVSSSSSSSSSISSSSSSSSSLSSSSSSSSSSLSSSSSSSSSSISSSSSSSSSLSSSSSSSSSSLSSSSSSSSSLSSSSSSSLSSSSSSSSSLSSSSSSSALPEVGCYAFGEQTPLAGEVAKSWQNWHLIDGVSIDGDADWGKLKLGSIGGDYAVNNPVDLVTEEDKQLTITRDLYGDGSGNIKVSIRGQANSFNWDDGEPPSWEEYTVPVNKSWRWVQTKVEWKV